VKQKWLNKLQSEIQKYQLQRILELKGRTHGYRLVEKAIMDTRAPQTHLQKTQKNHKYDHLRFNREKTIVGCQQHYPELQRHPQPTWIWYSILVVASEYTQHSNPTDLHNSEAKMTSPKMCINDIGN
jgi:hypothetical protein